MSLSQSPTPTDSTSVSSTADAPQALWSVASSLITFYYPSSAVTNVASLSWPGTVVVDGSTIRLDTTATSVPTSSLSGNHTVESSSASSGGRKTTQDSKGGDSDDRNVGIILGVVLGLVALALLVFFVCWALRRKKRNNPNTPRSASSAESASLQPWQLETAEDTAYSVTPSAWLRMYNRDPNQLTPAISGHPAFIHEQTRPSTGDRNPFTGPYELSGASVASEETAMEGSIMTGAIPAVSKSRTMPTYVRELTNSSTSESVAFVTPEERMDAQLGHDDSLLGAGAESELSGTRQVQPPRAPTPVFPTLFDNEHDRRYAHNPFASTEDSEEDELVSPIVPRRSSRRKSSRMITYPSWEEVSAFDFGSNRRQEERDVADARHYPHDPRMYEGT